MTNLTNMKNLNKSACLRICTYNLYIENTINVHNMHNNFKAKKYSHSTENYP